MLFGRYGFDGVFVFVIIWMYMPCKNFLSCLGKVTLVSIWL